LPLAREARREPEVKQPLAAKKTSQSKRDQKPNWQSGKGREKEQKRGSLDINF
jgi:hypothetical protein